MTESRNPYGEDHRDEDALEAPGPGSPVGESAEEAGDDSSQATGAPRISGEDQAEGQTGHSAPPEDVGVPEDTHSDS